MEPSVLIALFALVAAVITAAFTFFASRRTADDSRTIGLINAGQTALEQALDRTTAEGVESRKLITEMRAELAEVRRELDRALDLHSECERMRIMDSREIAKLRAIIEGKQ